MTGKNKMKKSKEGKKKGKGKGAPQNGVVTAKVQANSQKSVVPNQDRRLGAGKGGHPHAAFHHAVCGQTDPFCSHALGARIPDGNAGRSLTYQVRGSLILGANAAGIGGVVLKCNYPYQVILATGVSTTLTWVTTPTAFPGASAFSNSVGYWRCVSFGVRLGSILNATNNGGFMIVNSTATIPATITPPDMEYDDAKMVPLNNFTGSTWISKRLSNYALYQALDQNSSVGYPYTTDEYTSCIVTIAGCTPSTNALLLEVVTNYEFTPLPDTASAMLAQKEPVRNDSVLTGASHVQSLIPATFAKGVEDVGSVIESVVKSSPLGMIASIGASLLKAL